MQSGKLSSSEWLQCSARRTSVESQLVYLVPSKRPDARYHIRESCRLAALLYVNMILRQLPPASAAVRKLAELMRRSLEMTLTGTDWEEQLDLLWWILFLGGLASTSKPDSLWFRSQQMILAPSLKIADWATAWTSLRRIAWPENLLVASHEELWKVVKQGMT